MARRRSKPPLELSVEIETADGQGFVLDGQGPAKDRPRGISFGSQRGDGFAEAGCSFARRGDLDYPDLNLLDKVTFRGADGEIAYQGYHSANPRGSEEGPAIELSLDGPMTLGRDRPIQFLGVDSELGSWREASMARKTSLISLGWNPKGPEVIADPSSGEPALELAAEDTWTTGGLPHVSALYDAKGLDIGSFVGAWKRAGTIDHTVTNWFWSVYGAALDDFASGVIDAGNLRAAGPGTVSLDLPAGMKFLELLLYHSGTNGAAGTRYSLFWTLAQVFGAHGLERIGESPQGLRVSDVIRATAAIGAPQLSTEGVQESSYPWRSAVWLDPTDPYDIWLQGNDFHLWELNAFEGPTLHFGPADLSRHNWEVEDGQAGCSVRFDGDSAETLRNGIVVQFTDRAGETRTIYPTDFPDALMDPNSQNPATRHGREKWGEPVVIPYMTTEADAVQIGSAVLAEELAPRSPAVVTVKGGYVLDAQGNWQQGWKPRCSQTLAITNHPNPRPRLITDARWDQDSKTATLTLERPSKRVEALFNRIQSRLRAANLAS